jgi:hypothetical protein
VKNGPITEEETRAIRRFCDTRSFDVAYYPGIRAQDVNRYNLMDRPYLYEGATALLGGGREGFFNSYKFYIRPATDDRPYFFHFFKWRSLPEILSLRRQGGVALLEWTYPMLVATLLQAIVASLVLILIPLRALKHGTGRGGPRSRVAIYFLSLGLAFLFIEIAFIQKIVLFLSHPIYAIAVVLCAFLVFAGLGSGYSSRWASRIRRLRRRPEGLPIAGAVLGIVLIAVIYLVELPPIFERLMPLSAPLKVPIAVALIAPLAFCMGMPFPLGLSRVAHAMPDFIPWAWGLNGCASVLAIHFGFTTVVVAALMLYVVAALALLRHPSDQG